MALIRRRRPPWEGAAILLVGGATGVVLMAIADTKLEGALFALGLLGVLAVAVPRLAGPTRERLYIEVAVARTVVRLEGWSTGGVQSEETFPWSEVTRLSSAARLGASATELEQKLQACLCWPRVHPWPHDGRRLTFGTDKGPRRDLLLRGTPAPETPSGTLAPGSPPEAGPLNQRWSFLEAKWSFEGGSISVRTGAGALRELTRDLVEAMTRRLEPAADGSARFAVADPEDDRDPLVVSVAVRLSPKPPD